MLVRFPVLITGTTSRHDHRLVGHEATAYSGSGKAFDLLGGLIRLSAEASAVHRSGYVGIDEVTVEPLALDAVTEKVLL
jgi:hypothetical protein